MSDKTSSGKAPRDLRLAVKDPGFTPSARHVPELAELAADEDLGEAVERSLARLGAALAAALGPVVGEASPRARVHLYRALGRTGDATVPALDLLARALRDVDERARRAAEGALGKVGIAATAEARAAIESSLLDVWPRASTDPERRAIAEALGKVGGERSRALLEGLAPADPELARIVTKARLVLARGERRQEPGRIRGDVTPTAPLSLVFACRRGLEPLVIAELEGIGLEPFLAAPGQVRVTGSDRPLAALFRSRIAERFAIALPAVKTRAADDVDGTSPASPERGRNQIESLTRGLLDLEPLLGPLTEGPIRFRLSWRGGGHRRAVVWKIAERVAAASSRLVNDPTNTLWEVEVDDRDHALRLTIAPRGLPDPRFGYRARDVPAASHPTIAAALAHVAGVSPRDVVWDPFVGSGLELVERAKLGPFRSLHGSDVDPRALEAAAANLASAGVDATLAQADATEHFPEGTNVVITNPPMGRRVHRSDDLGAFLARFVAHVLRRLPAGGRFVWLAPSVALDEARSAKPKPTIERFGAVDVGGFEAELQRITKK